MTPPVMHAGKDGASFSDQEGVAVSTETFEVISRILKQVRGFNLEIYKDKCIKRRIAIRIRATGCATADEYCNYLLQNDSEIDRLLKVLTIHVSQFFRNPSTFEKLRQSVIPNLFSLCSQKNRQELRCWSVGCAGGEEPYSLALIFREEFAPFLKQFSVEILATDVDAAIIDAARQGEYGEERLAEVPLKMRQRWFIENRGKFHLLPEITNMVEFRRADLFDLERFEDTDLILCRNVLIYLERSQQEKIMKRFAEVLQSGGILVLGKSETLVGETRRLFKTLCPVERVYQVI